MGYELHPRRALTNQARRKISDAISDSFEIYDITIAEMFYILSDEISTMSAIAIRAEREEDDE